MKYLIPATIFFIIGLIFLIVTYLKYSKDKKKSENNETISIKPYLPGFAIMLVCFVVAQILLFMNK